MFVSVIRLHRKVYRLFLDTKESIKRNAIDNESNIDEWGTKNRLNIFV